MTVQQRHSCRWVIVLMPLVLGMAQTLWAEPGSLSDIDRSTAANDPQPSAAFSARNNPQCIPANTPPVFPGLRPCIWPHLLRLVTNGNAGQAPEKGRVIPIQMPYEAPPKGQNLPAESVPQNTKPLTAGRGPAGGSPLAIAGRCARVLGDGRIRTSRRASRAGPGQRFDHGGTAHSV